MWYNIFVKQRKKEVKFYGKNTEYRHYFLYIRTNNRNEENPEMNIEYFNNAEDMLNRINELTLEHVEQNKPWCRHFDYDYIYFL